MKKRAFNLMALLLMSAMIGCVAHTHIIGDGPQGNKVIKKKQWYVVWGLVPINEVDTRAMAGDATDYQITTVYKAEDVLANIFLNYVTVGIRTVEVTK